MSLRLPLAVRFVPLLVLLFVAVAGCSAPPQDHPGASGSAGSKTTGTAGTATASTTDAPPERETEWDGLPWLHVEPGQALTVNASHRYRLDVHEGLLMQGGNLNEVPHLGLGDWLELNDHGNETYLPIFGRIGLHANGTRYDLSTGSCTHQTRFTDVEEHWTVACNVTIARSATGPSPAPGLPRGNATVRLNRTEGGDVLMAHSWREDQSIVAGIGSRASDTPFLYLWGEYDRAFDGERLDRNGATVHLLTPTGAASQAVRQGALASGQPIVFHTRCLDVAVTPSGNGARFDDYSFAVSWTQTAPLPSDDVLVDYSVDRPAEAHG